MCLKVNYSFAEIDDHEAISLDGLSLFVLDEIGQLVYRNVIEFAAHLLITANNFREHPLLKFDVCEDG